jgi:hypothetical protein
MALLTGGHCDGQHNTIYLPYSEDFFHFPSQSLWLPPSSDESDERPSSFYLGKIESAPIASWHSLPEMDILGIVTSKSPRDLSIYTIADTTPTEITRCSFSSSLTNLYWSPDHYAGMAITEEDLSYFSFDPLTKKITQRPLMYSANQIMPPSWSGNGRYCAIGIQSTTPVIDIYKHSSEGLLLQQKIQLKAGQKISAIALNQDGTTLSLAFLTGAKKEQLVYYDVQTTSAERKEGFSVRGKPFLLKLVPNKDNTFLMSVTKKSDQHQLIMYTIDEKDKIKSTTVLESEDPIDDFSWHPSHTDHLGVSFTSLNEAKRFGYYALHNETLTKEDEAPSVLINSQGINWTSLANSVAPSRNYRLSLTNVKLASNGPVQIKDPLYIDGSVLWDGAWHNLSFAEDRYIFISSESKFTLRHALLNSSKKPLVVHGEPDAYFRVNNTTLPKTGLCSHVPVTFSGTNTIRGELTGIFTVTEQSILRAPTNTSITGTLTVNGTLKIGAKTKYLIDGKLITSEEGVITGGGTLKINGCIKTQNNGTLHFIGTHLMITKDCVLTCGKIILENCRVSFGSQSYVVHKVVYEADQHTSLMNAVRR